MGKIWVNKITKDFFEMEYSPIGDEDKLTYDVIEVVEEKLEKIKLKREKGIKLIYDNGNFVEIENKEKWLLEINNNKIISYVDVKFLDKDTKYFEESMEVLKDEIEIENIGLYRIVDGTLKKLTKKELFDIGEYILLHNEIIRDDEIVEVELEEFEYIEDNKIKYNRQGKIEKIKKELYDIRIEKEVAPFEFEVNGKIYLQQNRLIDQSSITKVLFQMVMLFIYRLMLNALKGKIPNLTTIITEAQKLSFKNWKFYTTDNSEKYENVTIMKFLEMSQKMNLQTTISMVTETELKHKLDILTDEEIKLFDVKTEYEKRFNEEMIEATKESNNILGD